MSRWSTRRWGFAVLGGLTAVSIVAAVAAELDDSGLGRLYDLGLLAWVVPVIAGAAVGALAWLVLDGLPDEDDGESSSGFTCRVCGHPMLDDWRMCPHCGAVIGRGPVRHDGVSADR